MTMHVRIGSVPWTRSVVLFCLEGVLVLFAGSALRSLPAADTGLSVRNVQSCEAFSSIQAAVDDPDTRPGHTLLLSPGTYVENVQVGKAVVIRSLSGDPGDTVVKAADLSAPVFTLLADGCVLRAVGIRGASSSCGVHVYTASKVTVSECEIACNGCGVRDEAGRENTYTRNRVLSNLDLGFLLTDSRNVVLEENLAGENGHDRDGDGIRLCFTDRCRLSSNTCRGNEGAGFHLHEAVGTLLEGNRAEGNGNGAIRLYREKETAFKDNVFQGPEGGLDAKGAVLSAREGGEVRFILDAGLAHGGARYALVASASGTEPGTVLDRGRGLVLPLNMDAFSRLFASASTAGGPSFQGFLGVLDGLGRAEAVLRMKGPLPHTAAGMTLHFAFVVHSRTTGWDFASRAVEVKITP